MVFQNRFVVVVCVLPLLILAMGGCTPAVLSVSPTSLSWSGTDSAPKSLEITNGAQPGLFGRQPLGWQASADVDWVTLGKTSGTEAKSLMQVSLDGSKLAAGQNTGKITITDNSNPPQKAEVGVSAVGPTLAVTPDSLTFGSETTRMLQVSNAGLGSLQWSASASRIGVTFDPPSGGNGPTQVRVTINRADLSPGPNEFWIYIIAAGWPTVTVTATAEGPVPPTLAVSADSLTFGPNDTSKTLTVSNSGGGVLTWNVSDQPSWVLLDKTEDGNGPTTVTVTIDRSALSSGTNSGDIRITSNGGDFTVHVTAAGPDKPQAGFAVQLLSGDYRAPVQVRFTDQSFSPPTAPIRSWLWNFGDDTPLSNETNPEHTYEMPRKYTVTLTVTSSAGDDTEVKADFITVQDRTWVKRHDLEPGIETLNRVKPTSDGGVIGVGLFASGGGILPYAIKFNKDGESPQGPQTFTSHWGAPFNGFLCGVAEDTDRGYIAVGARERHLGQFDFSCWLVKLAQDNLAVEWERVLDTPDTPWPIATAWPWSMGASIIVTKDGYYYAITGTCVDPVGGSRDLFIMEVGRGEQREYWRHQYSHPTYNDMGFDITELDSGHSGHFVAVGQVIDTSGVNPNRDVWMVRVNVDGVVQWGGPKQYGGDREQLAFAVAQLPGGNLVVAGTDETAVGRQLSVSTVDLGNGSVSLNETYGYGQALDPFPFLNIWLAWSDLMPAGGMYLDKDGNIVAGGTIRNSSGDNDMWYVKVNPQTLHPVWGPRPYGGPNYEVLTTIAPSPTGGIILGGAFSENWPANTESTTLLVRTDSEGTPPTKSAWLDALLGLK